MKLAVDEAEKPPGPPDTRRYFRLSAAITEVIAFANADDLVIDLKVIVDGETLFLCDAAREAAGIAAALTGSNT